MTGSAAQPTRRRQRSVRVVTAVVLVALGALTVLASALSGSWVVLLLAAATAVVLGAIATKITHTELADTRRVAARDRADLARDYHDLQVLRGAENEQFAEAMQNRLAAQHDRVNQLGKSLAQQRGQLNEARQQLAEAGERAEKAEGEVTRVSRQLEEAKERAALAEMRVVELEQQLEEAAASWARGDRLRKRA